MPWQDTPYTLPLLMAGAVCAGLALYAWRRRAAAGARTFALLMVALAVWSAGNALELAALDLPTKLRWIKLQYTGIVVVATAWLALALQYTGRGGWLTRRRLSALAIVPSATLLLVLTNEAHGLFWSDVWLVDAGAFRTWEARGKLFWVHIAYSYLLLSLGCGLLVQALLRSPRVRHAQAGSLLLALLAPWAANAITLSGSSPIPYLDLTPFAFTLSGLAFGLALFRFGLLELVSVARAAVIDGMDDAVVVLDAHERVLDLNPAARGILGSKALDAIGQPAAGLFSPWPVLDASRATGATPCEIDLGEGEGARSYEVRHSPLYERRRLPLGRGDEISGGVIVLRDITRRKRTEEAVRLQSDHNARLFESERAARERAERLLAATRALSSTMDLPQVLARILTELQQVVPYDTASAQELKGERLEIVGGRGQPGLEALLGHGFDATAGDNPNAEVLRTREPLILDDAPRLYASFLTGPTATDIRSWLGVPLLLGDRLIGMLSLDKKEPGFYTPEHSRLALAFATQAAVAIENARLYTSAQQELIERKRAQEELQRSEARYREIVETAADLIYRTDTAGRFTYVNPMTQRLFGFSEAEMIGRTYVEFVRPDWREKVVEFYASQYFGLVPHTYFELPVITKDGRELWLGCSAHLLLEHDAPVAFHAINRDITERKRAEQALKESEERNRAIVETAYDAFVTMDASGRITALNPQAETTFGWSRAEAVGRMLAETIIPARYREAHGKGLERFLATGEGAVLNKRLELTALHKDGREFPVELTISAVRWGATHLFHAFVHDISERKRAERLRAAQFAVTHILADSPTLGEATPRLLEALGEGMVWDLVQMWLSDPDSGGLRWAGLWKSAGLGAARTARFEEASRTVVFERGVGLPGRVWESGQPAWIDDVLTDPGFPRAASAAEAGLHGALAFPITSGAGVVGVMEFFTREVRSPDPALLELAGDIGLRIGQFAERRWAEQALRASEERFRQLAENIDAVFFMCSLHPARMLYVSPTYERVWGRSRDPLYHDPTVLVDAVHPADRDAFLAALQDQAQGYDMEYRILRPDGSTRWIRSRAFPVRGEEGEVRRVAGIAEDVTERKLFEQLRDDLTHTLVHDLRNPLTPTLGFLELMQLAPGSLSAGQREMLDFAARGTRRVLGLVNEILDVSRLEEGALPLERERLSLSALVSEAFDLQAPLAREKELRLESDVPDALPPAWADPGLVGRVLQNLVGNAIKFTPQGGVARVSARVDDADPRMLRVVVADTGPGIPPEVRSRLFEKFVTGRQQGRGSGLGLAFCRLAVEAHGGRIWAESGSAGGATFAFTLTTLP